MRARTASAPAGLCRLLLAAAAALLTGAWGHALAAAAAGPRIDADSVAAFFDTAFDVQRQDHRIAGAVVAVVYQGDVLFLDGYGWADIEARVPADPRQSLFRIASITKPFIWTALMQLRERGELALDDAVDDLIDVDIPDTFAEPIRIRHLMTHTPGFEERGTGSAVRGPGQLTPLRDYLIDAMPARVRPPGEQASYSNYGTALAGYVLQRISGQPWSDYVDANILRPLDMRSTNTHGEVPAALQVRLARSYRYRSGRFEPIDYLYALDGPAGQMSTTAADMAQFMLAHLGDGSGPAGRMLQPASVQEMRGILFRPHPDIEPMLHGFIRSNRNGQAIYGHGGDVNGFHSNLSLFPELGLGVFVSFNSDPAAVARGNLVNAFVDHFFPEPYLRRAPDPVTLQIAGYAGEYLPLRRNVSTFERLAVLNERTSVRADGDQLLLRRGGNVSRWVAVGDDAFTGLHAETPLAFRRGDDGRLYMYLGSALGTFERATTLHAPSVLRGLFGFVAVVFALAVLGWGYRAVRPAEPNAALPRLHVTVGWLHAALTLYLLIQLALTLTGDVEEFQFGVPAPVDRNLTLMSGNLVLGALVVVLAAWQWLRSRGNLGSRLRYGLVAVAALVNVWLAVYFNYAGYALALINR